jgi:hypothetical protein
MSGFILGSILNNEASAVATPAVDVVGVFDQNFNQLFTGARPIKAKVNPAAKLMEHPIETGAVISDHRIFLPIEIELNLVFTAATYTSDYQAVKAAFAANDTLVVLTRTDSYPNMIMQAMPHEETAEQADTITMIMSLRQVVIVSASSMPVAAAAQNSATVKTGAQTGKAATTTQSTTLQNGGGGTGSTLFGWFGKGL